MQACNSSFSSQVDRSAKVATIRSCSRCRTLLPAPRDVLGDQTYESLAQRGETMTTAVMVAYVSDQIDQPEQNWKCLERDDI